MTGPGRATLRFSGPGRAALRFSGPGQKKIFGPGRANNNFFGPGRPGPDLWYGALNAKNLGISNFYLPLKKITRLRPFWVKIKNGLQIRKEHILFDLEPTYLIKKSFKTDSIDHFTLEPCDTSIKR